MASFPPITMTTEGLNMIAKASSGNIEDRLIITKVKLGDGISTGNIRDYTDVISSKKEVTLSNWENRGDGRFRYTFVYNNEGIKIGFYHREIGLFAKSGNDGAEKLIAYTNAGSYPGYIDDETNKIPYQSLMINIGVGDTDNVSGEVDVSNAITIEMLNEHKNDENAHSNLIKNIFGIEEVTEGNIKEKIEEYAKKVCLPLSGGTMEGLVSLFTGSTIPTPIQQDNSKKITNTEWVREYIDNFLVGNIIYRPFLENGYVKLNGATVNRSDYPRLVQYATDNSLFTADNTTTPWLFGNGDGEITFVLPDYRNLFIEGGDTPSKIKAGLPNITGGFYARNLVTGGSILGGTSLSSKGAFMNETSEVWSGQHESVVGQSVTSPERSIQSFDASKSNAIYGASTTVQPPAIVLIPQIKY